MKSHDHVSDFVKRHASRPYNKAGMHLLLTSCIMTSSEAILPYLRNTVPGTYLQHDKTILTATQTT